MCVHCVCSIPSMCSLLCHNGPTARWYNNRKRPHIANCAKPECVTPQQGDVCNSQQRKSICYHKSVKSPLNFVFVVDSRHWSWFGWRDRRGAPGSTRGTTCCGTWTWCHQHRKSSFYRLLISICTHYINIMWAQILYIAVSLALALLSMYISALGPGRWTKTEERAEIPRVWKWRWSGSLGGEISSLTE